MQQLITPNPNIECRPGWCLQYVQNAYGLTARYGTAFEAWQASTTQHADQAFPDGVDVPVWFTLQDEPAGHVAIRMSDGTVYSTSDLTNTPHHHPSLDDLMGYYAYYGKPLTYLGWTEDVEGFPVLTKGNRMATLDLDDLRAIQGFANTNGDRVVNELHAQVNALANLIGQKIGLSPDDIAQALLKEGTVTINAKS